MSSNAIDWASTLDIDFYIREQRQLRGYGEGWASGVSIYGVSKFILEKLKVRRIYEFKDSESCIDELIQNNQLIEPLLECKKIQKMCLNGIVLNKVWVEKRKIANSGRFITFLIIDPYVPKRLRQQFHYICTRLWVGRE